MWSNKGPKAGNTRDLKYVYYLILKTQIADELWIAVKGVVEGPEQSSFWEMFYTAYISLIIYSRTYKILGDIQKCNIDHSEHIQEINIVLLVVLPWEHALSRKTDTCFRWIGQSVPKASTRKKGAKNCRIYIRILEFLVCLPNQSQHNQASSYSISGFSYLFFWLGKKPNKHYP